MKASLAIARKESYSLRGVSSGVFQQPASGRAPSLAYSSCKDRYVFTAPVKSFKLNAFGLFDVHGNAWTWTQDCWTDNYKDAPQDGSARTAGDCEQRVLRGGSWNSAPQVLRAASRGRNHSSDRYYGFGFRVARTIAP